jgi:hypothetical protein
LRYSDQIDLEWSTEGAASREVVMRKSAAQSTLDEYLNKKPDREFLILKDSELRPAELYMIAFTRRQLSHYHENLLSICHRLPLPERPDLEAYHRGSAIFLLSADTQKLIGGTYNGTIVIDEEFRGQGMATLIHVLNDENDLGCLAPTHYSEGGYATRVSAHKILCDRAHERGEDVLPENLEAYGISMSVALGM